MLGKPIQLPEARDLYQNGLKIVSCYQYGKQETADWLGGQAAGVTHARRGDDVAVGSMRILLLLLLLLQQNSAAGALAGPSTPACRAE